MAVFPAGHILTSADFDTLFPTGIGAYSAYTPTWSSNSGTPPAIGNGTILGKYFKAGRFTHVYIYMLTGTTSTYGSAGIVYSWSLPAGSLPVNSAYCAGTGVFVDASASGRFSRTAFGLSSSTVALHTEAGVYVGPASPMTWATGDSVLISICYESTS